MLIEIDSEYRQTIKEGDFLVLTDKGFVRRATNHQVYTNKRAVVGVAVEDEFVFGCRRTANVEMY